MNKDQIKNQVRDAEGKVKDVADRTSGIKTAEQRDRSEKTAGQQDRDERGNLKHDLKKDQRDH